MPCWRKLAFIITTEVSLYLVHWSLFLSKHQGIPTIFPLTIASFFVLPKKNDNWKRGDYLEVGTCNFCIVYGSFLLPLGSLIIFLFVSSDNVDLGTACGKYFRVCCLSVIDPGNAKIGFRFYCDFVHSSLSESFWFYVFDLIGNPWYGFRWFGHHQKHARWSLSHLKVSLFPCSWSGWVVGLSPCIIASLDVDDRKFLDMELRLPRSPFLFKVKNGCYNLQSISTAELKPMFNEYAEEHSMSKRSS